MAEFNNFKVDIDWVLGRHLDRILQLLSERTISNPDDRDRISQALYMLDALLTPYAKNDIEYIKKKDELKKLLEDAEKKESDEDISERVLYLYLANLSELMKRNGLVFDNYKEYDV